MVELGNRLQRLAHINKTTDGSRPILTILNQMVKDNTLWGNNIA